MHAHTHTYTHTYTHTHTHTHAEQRETGQDPVFSSVSVMCPTLVNFWYTTSRAIPAHAHISAGYSSAMVVKEILFQVQNQHDGQYDNYMPTHCA